MRRRMMLVAAVALAAPVALAPRVASAEGLFDFLFGGAAETAAAAAGPAASQFLCRSVRPQPAARAAAAPVASGGSGPAFCVRSCDGRYFPLARGNATPVQMCQAFCPASPTKVFFGSTIDGASSSTGERYADSENAFAYRKALRADCTCNGRDPAGLAPVDLTLDTSLRSGDVIATTDGLVAYSGVRARHQPDRRIHAGCFLSGPDRRSPRPARRDEGGAGERGNDRRRSAVARDQPRRRAAVAESVRAEERATRAHGEAPRESERWIRHPSRRR